MMEGRKADVAARRPLRVLFACTWNATRSPMAQAFAASLDPGVEAVSAGVSGALPVDPMATQAMGELGVDISRHQPVSFAGLEEAGGDLGAFDLIVALSGAAEEAAREVARFAPVAVERWDVPDVTGEGADEAARLVAYRRVRDLLGDAVARRFGPRRAVSA